MSLRYSPEELLHLRQSPLCVKPKELPPLEDWIGQAIDDKSKRVSGSARLLRDGQPPSVPATTVRPGALDFTRHKRETSNGDFAKELYSPGARDPKNFDSPSRASFGVLSPRGEQPTGMGRFTAGDREQGPGRGDRATTRFSALRASKDEGDSWLTGKTTRKHNGDETEKTFTRRVDRDTDTVRENGREHRRYGSEAINENIRNRDWRAGDKTGARLANRDWNNGQEQDPEWMMEETPAPREEKKTVEDFEAWKRAMKAEDAASKAGPAPEEARPQPAAPKKMIETPLALDAGEDKFFGFFGMPNQTSAVPQPAGEAKQQPATTVKGGKSKFSNFFAAPEPPLPQAQPVREPRQSIPFFNEQAAPTPPASGLGHKPPASEDEQGFQRILDMLKAKSPNPTPQSNTAFKPPRQRTPPREAISTSATPPLVSPRPKIHGVQQFLNPQSPGANPDSQFLLNLMRTKDSQPVQQPRQTPPNYTGPNGQRTTHAQPPHYQQHLDRNHEEQFRGDLPPGFDKLNPSAHLLNQRRHGRYDSRTFDEPPPQHQQHGPPPGFQHFPPGMNAPEFPPGLPPMPGQRGPYPGGLGAAPPGFGPGGPGGPRPGPGPGPGPGFGPLGPGNNFPGGRGGPNNNFPPGFNIPNMAGLHLGGGDHGPGPGMPPGFHNPAAAPSRVPPGFAERGMSHGMPMNDMYDGRRGDQGVFGTRE